MKRTLLFYILLFSFITLNSQNTVGTISVTADVYDGYTLFSTHTKAHLLDNCGQVINTWSSTYLPGNSVYLLPNGNLLRTGRLAQGANPIALPGAGGVVELFDWDGNILWTWIDSSETSRQHHDVFPMPNGNVLILSADIITQAEAIQAGRDPLQLLDSELYNERIYEVEPDGATGGTIVWEWNVKDHLIQNLDPTKDNFGVVADNPGKVNINFLNGFDAENNWLHINAIQYDEEFDQIIISSRRMSEIWAIDHSITTAQAAGVAGDLLYRWGNPQAYDQGTVGDRKLFGQHTPHYIPSGLPNARKIMLFNNGFGRTPEYSEVVIIDPPVDINGNYTYTPGTAYGPTSTFFRYPDTPPASNSEFYSAIISSARQLPNGNILVCEGREAFFFELDTNNNIVWEYASPISNADGTVYDQGDPIPPNNFAFRATKYSTSYSAFDGRDLTPGAPLENNPDITSCQSILSDEDFEVINVTLYPNPVQDYLNIEANVIIEKIEFYSISGAKILESSKIDNINISSLRKGVYFAKIYSGEKSMSKKIIKQ
ncbi:MAG: T9SS type A sorting domain-containing protein [Winogradskyella sp.]|nr:MAG: T9SS type A sorting domain-containing protein [Winogradskyella sp.]